MARMQGVVSKWTDLHYQVDNRRFGEEMAYSSKPDFDNECNPSLFARTLGPVRVMHFDVWDIPGYVSGTAEEVPWRLAMRNVGRFGIYYCLQIQYV
jgi:hypothetical protein